MVENPDLQQWREKEIINGLVAERSLRSVYQNDPEFHAVINIMAHYLSLTVDHMVEDAEKRRAFRESIKRDLLEKGLRYPE